MRIFSCIRIIPESPTVHDKSVSGQIEPNQIMSEYMRGRLTAVRVNLYLTLGKAVGGKRKKSNL
jgi:hypothetical protein